VIDFLEIPLRFPANKTPNASRMVAARFKREIRQSGSNLEMLQNDRIHTGYLVRKF
jgi:hypothetical protein